MPGQLPPPQLVLRDIHMPPAPSWWPPAPGWWLSALLLLLLIVLLAWLATRRFRRRRALRQVLAEVDRLDTRHADDDEALAYGLHQLLRRMARRYAAGAVTARGESWRTTLAEVPVQASVLDTLVGLEQRIYRSSSAFDRVQALAATRTWLSMAWRRMPGTHRSKAHA
ncbi:DUF4381 family protein [Dyella sp. A6]|uniref:DUF4381 family protein n=1 Tax=Dyella aluminiiresistens TaxID=3069105 RepID=UPI002E77C94D|nr:DUF4381 family protein [Dyella sp. A6]